jgi:hypothetical protein
MILGCYYYPIIRGISLKYQGHLKCINEIEAKIKSIKNVDKLTVDKVLKEINFQK